MTEEEIRRAVNHFKHAASPSNSGHGSAPATINDINALINETAKLFETLARSQNY